MAVTLDTEPEDFVSSYKPIIFAVSSDDGTIVRMKGFVYINDSIINPVTPIILDPDVGETDEFTFDIQEIVQDYVTYNLQTVNNGTVGLEATSSWVDIRMKFTEVVLTGGVLVDGADLDMVEGDNKLAGNGTLPYTTVVNDFEAAGYLLNDTDKKHLTNAPLTKWVREDESEMLAGMMRTGGAGYGTRRRHIETYNDSGLVEAATSTNGFPPHDILHFPIGAANINGVFGAGTINSNVNKYITWAADDSDQTQRTEKRTFLIDRRSYNQLTRFHFLNSLGGIDSFTFAGRHVEGVRVTSKEFEKLLADSYSIQDRGVTELQINSVEKFEVWSTLLNEDTLRWLKELYYSPQVFVQSGTNYLPVIILNKGGWKWDAGRGAIPQLKIQYIRAYPNETQRN